MQRGLIAAFSLGVVLTGAAFLLFGDPAPSATPRNDVPVSAAEPPAERVVPLLTGSAPKGLAGLELSKGELAWVRGRVREERIRKETARLRPDDTGITLLERVFEFDADPSELFGSFEAFRKPVIESTAAGVSMREPPAGQTATFTEVTGDPLVIDLGPGHFPLDKKDGQWHALYDNKVRTVVIRGAGIDKTTLVSGHGWPLLFVGGKGQVDHLVVRDLTLKGGAAQGALLEVRGKAAVVLENVRVNGWVVAGHAAAIGVSGNAYLACKGCEFVGRGEHSGWAISLRGNSLVYGEDCQFLNLESGTLIAEGEKTALSRAVFRDCTWDRSALLRGKTSAHVEVHGGRAAFGAASQTDEQRRELWGAPHAKRVDGTRFEAARPACTLGDLLDVLEKVSVPAEERVVGIALAGIEDDHPVRFTVWTLPKTGRRTKAYDVDVTGGLPVVTHQPRAGGRGLPPEALVRKAKSFVEILRGSDVGRDIPCKRLEYRHQQAPDGTTHATVAVGGWYLNAQTGEVLRSP
jgi:hypothetical protein